MRLRTLLNESKRERYWSQCKGYQSMFIYSTFRHHDSDLIHMMVNSPYFEDSETFHRTYEGSTSEEFGSPPFEHLKLSSKNADLSEIPMKDIPCIRSVAYSLYYKYTGAGLTYFNNALKEWYGQELLDDLFRLFFDYLCDKVDPQKGKSVPWIMGVLFEEGGLRVNEDLETSVRDVLTFFYKMRQAKAWTVGSDKFEEIRAIHKSVSGDDISHTFNHKSSSPSELRNWKYGFLRDVYVSYKRYNQPMDGFLVKYKRHAQEENITDLYHDDQGNFACMLWTHKASYELFHEITDWCTAYESQLNFNEYTGSGNKLLVFGNMKKSFYQIQYEFMNDGALCVNEFLDQNEGLPNIEDVRYGIAPEIKHALERGLDAPYEASYLTCESFLLEIGNLTERELSFIEKSIGSSMYIDTAITSYLSDPKHMVYRSSTGLNNNLRNARFCEVFAKIVNEVTRRHHRIHILKSWLFYIAPYMSKEQIERFLYVSGAESHASLIRMFELKSNDLIPPENQNWKEPVMNVFLSKHEGDEEACEEIRRYFESIRHVIIK